MAGAALIALPTLVTRHNARQVLSKPPAIAAEGWNSTTGRNDTSDVACRPSVGHGGHGASLGRPSWSAEAQAQSLRLCGSRRVCCRLRWREDVSARCGGSWTGRSQRSLGKRGGRWSLRRRWFPQSLVDAANLTQDGVAARRYLGLRPGRSLRSLVNALDPLVDMTRLPTGNDDRLRGLGCRRQFIDALDFAQDSGTLLPGRNARSLCLRRLGSLIDALNPAMNISRAPTRDDHRLGCLHCVWQLIDTLYPLVDMARLLARNHDWFRGLDSGGQSVYALHSAEDGAVVLRGDARSLSGSRCCRLVEGLDAAKDRPLPLECRF